MIQLALPIGELLIEHGALQPLTLPHGIVSILNRELRQWRGGLLEQIGGAQHSQLAREYIHRPPIADDVMHGQQENAVVLSQLYELGPQQRSAG